MNQSTWKSAPKVARRLLVTLAVAIPLGAQIQPPRYIVTDLGPVNNPFSQATGINIFGLISGFDTAADGTSHAFIAYEGMITDISKPGLGGPNSSAGGVNDFAEVVGGAETSSPDPNNENFCAYGTGLQCVPFVWRYGVMTQLTTLGGTKMRTLGKRRAMRLLCSRWRTSCGCICPARTLKLTPRKVRV